MTRVTKSFALLQGPLPVANFKSPVQASTLQFLQAPTIPDTATGAPASILSRQPPITQAPRIHASTNPQIQAIDKRIEEDALSLRHDKLQPTPEALAMAKAIDAQVLEIAKTKIQAKLQQPFVHPMRLEVDVRVRTPLKKGTAQEQGVVKIRIYQTWHDQKADKDRVIKSHAMQSIRIKYESEEEKWLLLSACKQINTSNQHTSVEDRLKKLWLTFENGGRIVHDEKNKRRLLWNDLSKKTQTVREPLAAEALAYSIYQKQNRVYPPASIDTMIESLEILKKYFDTHGLHHFHFVINLPPKGSTGKKRYNPFELDDLDKTREAFEKMNNPFYQAEVTYFARALVKQAPLEYLKLVNDMNEKYPPDKDFPHIYNFFAWITVDNFDMLEFTDMSGQILGSQLKLKHGSPFGRSYPAGDGINFSNELFQTSRGALATCIHEIGHTFERVFNKNFPHLQKTLKHAHQAIQEHKATYGILVDWFNGEKYRSKIYTGSADNALDEYVAESLVTFMYKGRELRQRRDALARKYGVDHESVRAIDFFSWYMFSMTNANYGYYKTGEISSMNREEPTRPAAIPWGSDSAQNPMGLSEYNL